MAGTRLRSRGLADVIGGFGLPFVAIVALAGDHGGYFPTSWGWVALGACWAAAIAATTRSSPRASATEAAFAGALLAFAGWCALSAAWSTDRTASMLEAERLALYAAVGLAAIVAVATAAKNLLVAAIVAGTTVIAAFALATRLVPDRIGVFDSTSGYRLAAPIGYWNGLAIFCVIGAVLAVGAAAHAERRILRSAAAGAVVLLVVTLYYTYGRAAWIALVVALAAACAFETRRLWFVTVLLVIALPAAAAVVVASRPLSLTSGGAPLGRAAHDGHRVAVAVLALGALAAVAVAVASAAATRLRVGRRVRVVYVGVLSAAVVAAATAGVAVGGGPAALARHAHAAFVGPPPHPTNLNKRLFSFSGNGRADLWRVAWRDYRAHDLLGSGAGSYGRYFLAHQPGGVGTVRDAHNLYLETLAETGPLGLVGLLLVLVIPFVAMPAARARRFVPAAAAAYVAFLVHAAADWDWELAGVTVPALLAAIVILVAARERQRRFLSPTWTRVAVLAPVVAVGGFSLVGLIGNSALAASDAATDRHDFGRAESYALRAAGWMPWAGDPWRALGAAQRSAGETDRALASFRKAASLDRGDWRVWYGIALTSRGHEQQAALARARDLYPRGGLTLRGSS